MEAAGMDIGPDSTAQKVICSTNMRMDTQIQFLKMTRKKDKSLYTPLKKTQRKHKLHQEIT